MTIIQALLVMTCLGTDLLGPGDVAVVPDPAYVAYLGGTLLSDATPHIVPLRPEHDFLVELEALPVEVLAAKYKWARGAGLL